MLPRLCFRRSLSRVPPVRRRAIGRDRRGFRRRRLDGCGLCCLQEERCCAAGVVGPDMLKALALRTSPERSSTKSHRSTCEPFDWSGCAHRDAWKAVKERLPFTV